MPTSVYPDTLATLFLKNCPDQELIAWAWPKILPLLMRAYSDTYPLADASALDAEAYAQALRSAFSTKVDRVRFVSVSGKDPFGNLTDEDLFTYVRVSLDSNRMPQKGYPFDAMRRMEGGRQFLDTFIDELGRPLVRTILTANIRSLHDVDAGIAAKLATAPTITLMAFLPYLYVGDRKVVEEMLPLVELLPHGLPVGEPFAEPGTWLVGTK